MATKRVTKKGCYVRPINGFKAYLRRRVKFNISVPMAIEAFTGKPFVNTWMQMKCGPMRWSGFWRRQAKRIDQPSVPVVDSVTAEVCHG